MCRISWEKLNNPSQETIDTRNRFLKECENLNTREEDGVTIIELDVDLEE